MSLFYFAKDIIPYPRGVQPDGDRQEVCAGAREY